MANNPSKGIKPEDKSKANNNQQPKQAPKLKKPVVEAPIEDVEVVDPKPGTNFSSAESKLARIGRLSPDGMVQFAGQLKSMYIDTDSSAAAAAASVISIQHRYLTHIALTQIGEDSNVLGMNIAPSELLAVQQAASVLKVEIQSALPAPENPEQLRIKFNPETIPTNVQEKIDKETESGNHVVDLDPTKVYTAEELKERLSHILNRDKSRSSNIPEAINWLENNLVTTATKAAEEFLTNNKLSADSAKDNMIYQDLCKAIDIAKATKKVDIFNQILDILGGDTPSIINGICSSVWKRYAEGDTVIPAHFYVKSFAKNWSDEDIRDFVTFVVNLEASRTENKDAFQKTAYLQNPTPEHIDFVVAKALKSFDPESKTNTPEASALRNYFHKFVVQKRVPIRERFGAVIQSYANLYIDQSNQAARLSKYQDMSSYSDPTPESSESEKKN